ncbi:MAG: 2-hydroxyacid dehydrogenase [Chitinispirillaceae bacterium]|nr:2-hydroxyacid dehydrogenase [Chitinispirillaceae bacterium]
MDKKIAFFDAKPYDMTSFDEANTAFGFSITYFEVRLSADTVAMAEGFDGVCAFVNDTLDSRVIDALAGYGIGIAALRCAGYNNVDFKAAYKRVHVMRVPAYSPHAVAEHAVALMMSLNRKTHRAYHRTRDGNFSIHGLLGFDMHGKTAGIIGTGMIGKTLAYILRGFGMTVLAFDPFPDAAFAKEAGVSYVEIDVLYQRSDIISLHCPLNRETHYLIDGRAIGRMKKGVMLINTGRGKLIDSKALIQGLKKGMIGSAGLDVYEEETQYFFEDRSTDMIADDVLSRLLTFPNVIVTSHQGFFTAEALHNIAHTTLGNLTAYFEGGRLENEICYFCNEPCRKKQEGKCF